MRYFCNALPPTLITLFWQCKGLYAWWCFYRNLSYMYCFWCILRHFKNNATINPYAQSHGPSHDVFVVRHLICALDVPSYVFLQYYGGLYCISVIFVLKWGRGLLPVMQICDKTTVSGNKMWLRHYLASEADFPMHHMCIDQVFTSHSLVNFWLQSVKCFVVNLVCLDICAGIPFLSVLEYC